MGVFIKIDVDESRLTPGVRQALVSVCPVDIFALDGGRLLVKPEREDECTLCELCLDTAPAGVLTIHKTYREDRLTSRKVDP